MVSPAPSVKIIALILASICIPPLQAQASDTEEIRFEQLVEANISGVHAYQILLARRQGNIDASCWPLQSPDDAALQALVEHQIELLKQPVGDIEAWARGEVSPFDPSIDLQPLLSAKLPLNPALPVNVFTNYLQRRLPSTPRSHIRSVANLYQTVLEVERD